MAASMWPSPGVSFRAICIYIYVYMYTGDGRGSRLVAGHVEDEVEDKGESEGDTVLVANDSRELTCTPPLPAPPAAATPPAAAVASE